MAQGQWFVNDSIAEMTQESKDACISLLRAALAETELEVQRLQAKLLKQNLDSGEQHLEQLNQRALLMGAVEKMLALVNKFSFSGCRVLAPDRLPPEGDIPAFCSWAVDFTAAALQALEEVKHLRRDKFGSTSEQGRYLGRPADEEETAEESAATAETDTGDETATETDGGRTEHTAADADKSKSRRQSSAGRNGPCRRELSRIERKALQIQDGEQAVSRGLQRLDDYSNSCEELAGKMEHETKRTSAAKERLDKHKKEFEELKKDPEAYKRPEPKGPKGEEGAESGVNGESGESGVNGKSEFSGDDGTNAGAESGSSTDGPLPGEHPEHSCSDEETETEPEAQPARSGVPIHSSPGDIADTSLITPIHATPAEREGEELTARWRRNTENFITTTDLSMTRLRRVRCLAVQFRNGLEQNINVNSAGWYDLIMPLVDRFRTANGSEAGADAGNKSGDEATPETLYDAIARAVAAAEAKVRNDPRLMPQIDPKKEVRDTTPYTDTPGFTEGSPENTVQALRDHNTYGFSANLMDHLLWYKGKFTYRPEVVNTELMLCYRHRPMYAGTRLNLSQGFVIELMYALIALNVPRNRMFDFIKREPLLRGISRNTLNELIINTVRAYVYGMSEQIRKMMLEGNRVINGDETPVYVVSFSTAHGRRHAGQVWVILSGTREKYPGVYYTPEHARQGDRLMGILTGNNSDSGGKLGIRYLQSDGFQVYLITVRKINEKGEAKIENAGCWTHSRRRFVVALDDLGLADVYAAALEGGFREFEARLASWEQSHPERPLKEWHKDFIRLVVIIAMLFHLEKKTPEQTEEHIARKRREHSLPLLLDFFARAKSLARRLKCLNIKPGEDGSLKCSKMIETSYADALCYALNHEKELSVYIDVPFLRIDNNVSYYCGG